MAASRFFFFYVLRNGQQWTNETGSRLAHHCPLKKYGSLPVTARPRNMDYGKLGLCWELFNAAQQILRSNVDTIAEWWEATTRTIPKD
jgi:hypothetical protein